LATPFKNPTRPINNLDGVFDDFNNQPSVFGKQGRQYPRLKPDKYNPDNPVFQDSRLQFRDDDMLFVNDTHIPEKWEHMFLDPMGIKKPRDLKLLKKAQKWGQRQSLRLVQKKPTVVRKKTIRQIRVANAVVDALNKAVTEDLKFTDLPGRHQPIYLKKTGLTFTQCEMVGDLSLAKVSWVCMPGYEEQVAKELNNLKKVLRHGMTKRMVIKYSPKLDFMKESVPQKRVELDALYDTAEATIQENEKRKKKKEQQKDSQLNQTEIDKKPLSVEDFFR